MSILGKESGKSHEFSALLAGIAAFDTQGVGWKRIAAEMGVGVGTIYRVALDGSKTPQRVF